MSIRHRPSRLVFSALLVVGALAACGDDDASDEVSTDPASSGASSGGGADGRDGPGSLTIDLVERDGGYAFELPASVEAGATRITLVNEGSEEHHASCSG